MHYTTKLIKISSINFLDYIKKSAQEGSLSSRFLVFSVATARRGLLPLSTSSSIFPSRRALPPSRIDLFLLLLLLFVLSLSLSLCALSFVPSDFSYSFFLLVSRDRRLWLVVAAALHFSSSVSLAPYPIMTPLMSMETGTGK